MLKKFYGMLGVVYSAKKFLDNFFLGITYYIEFVEKKYLAVIVNFFALVALRMQLNFIHSPTFVVPF
jgi:hypothetical protein